MNDEVLYFNKKNYHLRRVSNFYYEIFEEKSSLPYLFFTDGEYFFKVKAEKKTAFCHDCFTKRYLTFIKRVKFLENGSALLLDDKKAQNRFNEESKEKIISYASKRSRKSNELEVIDLSSFQKIFKGASVSSFEHCSHCFSSSLMPYSQALDEQGEALHASFMKLYNQTPDQNSFDYQALENFIEKDSFGLTVSFSVFRGGGVKPDPLAGRYISTLLTSFPDEKNHGGSLLLCGGQSKDKKVAKLKALMEYCERYAFKNKSMNSPLVDCEGMDNHIRTHILAFATNLCMFDSVQTSLHDQQRYALFGTDLVHKKKVLLPISLFFEVPGLPEIPFVSQREKRSRTSTNGYAAHIDFKKALTGATLELIERDAFIRWWMTPEIGRVIEIPGLERTIDRYKKSLQENGSALCDILLIAIDSPVGIPTVLACIISRDPANPPALLMGAGSGFSFFDAASRALDELAVAILNFIARCVQGMEWVETKINFSEWSSIRAPQDHIYLYHHPTVRSKLTFVDYFLKQKPTMYTTDQAKNESVKTFDELIENFKASRMNLYAADMTPALFKPYGVYVVRAFSPELYPLTFGFPLPYKGKISELSVAALLPHCFP